MAVRVEFKRHGGPDVLELVAFEPTAPGKNEVRVRNEAIGMNFIDIYYREGLYPVNGFPSQLGGEGAGVIDAIGEGVSDFAVGDRVAYASVGRAAYADQLCIATDKLVRLPSDISCEQAAAVMVKGLTVQYLFRQTYPLNAGDTILFHAAAGGVGSIACQWARAIGVKLIGTVSTEEKARMAASLGAWAVINYTEESVAERVLELTEGRKCPVVYDSVGMATWEASLDCLQPRGLMVSFGNASGPVTGVDLGILNRKGSLYVTRPTLKHYADTQKHLQAMSDELFQLIREGHIDATPRNRFALKDVRLAQQALASRALMGLHVLLP